MSLPLPHVFQSIPRMAVVLQSNDGSCVTTNAAGNLVAASFNYGTLSSNTSLCGSTTLNNLSPNVTVTATQESVYTIWKLTSVEPLRYLITSSAGAEHECLEPSGATVRRVGNIYNFCGFGSYDALMASSAWWTISLDLWTVVRPFYVTFNIQSSTGAFLAVDPVTMLLTANLMGRSARWWGLTAPNEPQVLSSGSYTIESSNALCLRKPKQTNPDSIDIWSAEGPNRCGAQSMDDFVRDGSGIWTISAIESDGPGRRYTISQSGRCLEARYLYVDLTPSHRVGPYCGYNSKEALFRSPASWELVNIPSTDLYMLRATTSDGWGGCLQSATPTRRLDYNMASILSARPALRAYQGRHCGFSNYTALLQNAELVWRLAPAPSNVGGLDLNQGTTPTNGVSENNSSSFNTGTGLSGAAMAGIIVGSVGVAICVGVGVYMAVNRGHYKPYKRGSKREGNPNASNSVASALKKLSRSSAVKKPVSAPSFPSPVDPSPVVSTVASSPAKSVGSRSQNSTASPTVRMEEGLAQDEADIADIPIQTPSPSVPSLHSLQVSPLEAPVPPPTRVAPKAPPSPRRRYIHSQDDEIAPV